MRKFQLLIKPFKIILFLFTNKKIKGTTFTKSNQPVISFKNSQKIKISVQNDGLCQCMLGTAAYYAGFVRKYQADFGFNQMPYLSVLLFLVQFARDKLYKLSV